MEQSAFEDTQESRQHLLDTWQRRPAALRHLLGCPHCVYAGVQNPLGHALDSPGVGDVDWKSYAGTRP